jgi:IS5 family transposase
LLKLSIEAARRGGFIACESLQRVIVDTTVMLKAVAHPTDSRLLGRSRRHLLKAARAHGLKVRQSYARTAPRLAVQVGRYAHARQFRRMRAALRALRTRVGRVHREVSRQVERLDESARANTALKAFLHAHTAGAAAR